MTLQAIVTKYFGPGNVRGSRIKATASAGSMFVEYDPSIGVDANHRAAAQAFAAKYKWAGNWYGGTLPDQSHAYVCAPFMAPEPAFIVESPEQ